jgi:uncharacterized protein (DUF58 family)
MRAGANRRAKLRAPAWLFRPGKQESGEVFLHRRRVYILPNKAGGAFTLLLLILLIGSINYELGLGFGLTFLAAAIGIVDMVLTYRNLAHLHLRSARVHDVFAGEEARFELVLINRTRRDRFALRVDFPAHADSPQPDRKYGAAHTVDVAAGESSTVRLAMAAPTRGFLDAPRVRILTRFPLGLFTSWSYWSPDARAIVYPSPEALAPPLPMAGRPGAQTGGGPGHDDFAGIRTYQPGDPMRHLAWRQIARLDQDLGGTLATKQFEAGARHDVVLDFQQLPVSLDLELRLARMTRWVLEAERAGLPYAFRLGGLMFDAASGPAHQAACLRALAQFGLPPHSMGAQS